MILFLDDSYERTGDAYCHVLGGFAISQEGHRQLVARMREVKAVRFLRDRDMTPEEREEAWQTRFIVGADPRDVELKASLLLSSSILRRRSSIALTVAREVLEALRDAGASVHAALSTPKTLRSGLTFAHLAVFEAAKKTHSGEIQPVLDGTNPTADRALARQYADRFASDPRLAPAPFIVDTHTSPGLQAADLVAHVLLHRARPEASRKPLEPLDAIVADMER